VNEELQRFVLRYLAYLVALCILGFVWLLSGFEVMIFVGLSFIIGDEMFSENHGQR
jgi:hypothetical protein